MYKLGALPVYRDRFGDMTRRFWSDSDYPGHSRAGQSLADYVAGPDHAARLAEGYVYVRGFEDAQMPAAVAFMRGSDVVVPDELIFVTDELGADGTGAQEDVAFAPDMTVLASLPGLQNIPTPLLLAGAALLAWRLLK